MEAITDWAHLWSELVENKNQDKWNSIEAPGDSDIWLTRAREYNDRVKIRWEKPDSTRETILSMLEPNSTILDIGAGTGSWSVLFSKAAQKVTAVEPSQAMREVMQENIRNGGIQNIDIVPEKWPEANTSVHDYAFCSHAMYGVADFPSFVHKMIECSSKMCFLLIRAVNRDNLLAEAAQTIWGQPYDSPNFVIAYNILIQMGIYANVRMEEGGKGFITTSETEEKALIEMKRRLGLTNNDWHDAYLKDLLHRRLIQEEDHLLWPGGVHSALIYWQPAKDQCLTSNQGGQR
jgi:2-polyprenyl-3-methyl-5-hydroxy-6-metoxy-1,4-benzoquinol methylase